MGLITSWAIAVSTTVLGSVIQEALVTNHERFTRPLIVQYDSSLMAESDDVLAWPPHRFNLTANNLVNVVYVLIVLLSNFRRRIA